MRKVKLALALGEAEYGRRMVTTFMNHYRSQVEIHLYLEDGEWMERLIKSKSDSLDLDFDLWILADLKPEVIEQMSLEGLKERLPILYLKDGEEEGEICERLKARLGEEGVVFVEKYQQVQNIMDEIMKMVGTEVNALYQGEEMPEKTALLGVYGLSENQYQLPFAITLASILGEEQKVLLLDLQENSGITQVLTGSPGMVLEDLLVSCEEEKISKARLIACIGHMGKLDLVYPAENSECLCEIGAKQYLKVIEILRNELDYDVILINYGARFQGFFEVIKHMKHLYMLHGKGGLAEWREFEFMSELEKRGYESFKERIQQVEIPLNTVSSSCERIVEQWKWNELGDSIRRMNAGDSFHA